MYTWEEMGLETPTGEESAARIPDPYLPGKWIDPVSKEYPIWQATVDQPMPDFALRDMFAGDAIFTLALKRTNDPKMPTRFTYRVGLFEKRDGDRVTYRGYSVRVLTRPDNEASSSYTYAGMFVPAWPSTGDGWTYRTTAASKIDDSAPSVRAIKWLVKYLVEHKRMPESAEVLFGGHCLRCLHLLTDPRSIKCFYGQTCAERVGVPWG